MTGTVLFKDWVSRIEVEFSSDAFVSGCDSVYVNGRPCGSRSGQIMEG
jgi:hypothetical protein